MAALLKKSKPKGPEKACAHEHLVSDGWMPPIYTCKACEAFGFMWQFRTGDPFPAEAKYEVQNDEG